YQCGQGG
nr:RecName: Full=Ascalin [Allium cepa var. aggregatum]